VDKVLEKLKNIPVDYRPIPFWSWNDKLDPEMLKWQVREMKRAGIGGYFMHARGGLETEYLSDEWMECINACVEEGKKMGMNSWIYDEAGWPSGFAGGIVTAMGDKYHARGLELKEIGNIDEAAGDKNVLGIYCITDGTGEIKRICPGDDTAAADLEGKLYAVRHVSSPYYIDVLNEEVVKAFLEVTHDKYYSLFGEEFGKAIKGFFTDEPRFSVGKVPWSYVIPEKFAEKYGYDVTDFLPALFLKCSGYEKVRHDFWALANELFVSAFMKQINEWCIAHDCILTGHAMMEESLYSQMTGNAGVMPFYEHMGMPGVDWLRRTRGSPVVPKQVGSAANQLGKKFVLTESYALSGWDVSFEELKWIAEWQYVNGVNLMCQHLEGYTLRGLRKRDYPPSLFYQQPWWDEYHMFNDYLARLAVILTSGRNVADVLVIHPMRSGWIAFDGENNETIKKLDADFVWVTETLSGMHIDYHYGDETIIEKYGSVNGDKVRIGKCEYKAVVLPSMITIDRNTAELLSQFANNGGLVISAGDFPVLCSGKPDDFLVTLKNKTVHAGKDRNTLSRELLKKPVRHISITSNGLDIENIHYQQRDLGNVQFFFLANHSKEESYEAEVTIFKKGRLKLLSLEKAELEDMDYNCEDDRTITRLKFMPMQSVVLVLEEGEEIPNKRMQHEENVVRLQLGKRWTIDEMDLNSITLDYCRYRIDGGEWEGPLPVIKLMDVLLNLRRSCDIELEFSFETDMDLQKNREMYLVLERPEEFEINVNGAKVQYKDAGWWRDSTFRKVDIKQFVKNGVNKVLLKRRFYQSQKVYDVLFGENVYETEKNKLTYDVELESIYILGDFGVISKSPFTTGERKALFTEGPFAIIDRPEITDTGELTTQGLCFFSGVVKLSQTVRIENKNKSRFVLDLGKPNAVMTTVFVNDKIVKKLLWAPYSVDITDFVTEGENKITLQLFSGNRNLLGPHHHINGELYNVGPMSFTGKWSWVERETEAVPLTEEQKKDYWTDRYCFVKFSID